MMCVLSVDRAVAEAPSVFQLSILDMPICSCIYFLENIAVSITANVEQNSDIDMKGCTTMLSTGFWRHQLDFGKFPPRTPVVGKVLLPLLLLRIYGVS